MIEAAATKPVVRRGADQARYLNRRQRRALRRLQETFRAFDKTYFDGLLSDWFVTYPFSLEDHPELVIPEPVREIQKRLAVEGAGYVRGYWDQSDGPRLVEWRESHDSATVARTRHILIDPDPGVDESEARISLLHEMCHAAIAARGEVEQEPDGEREYVANHGAKWLAELGRVIDAGAEFMRGELESYRA
jgi:hypothetical protein